MKKILKGISLFAAIIFIGLAVSCAKKDNASQVQNKFNSDSDMFAFATISTANIFGQTSNVTPTYKTVGNIKDSNDEIDMDKVNEYLQMMENLLVDDGPIVSKEEKSDRPEYEVKVTYVTKDLAGEETTFVIYYNQVLESENIEHSKKDEVKPVDDEEDDDDDEDETEEQEYTLNGIALVDGVEYTLVGEKELENNEYELKITISFDKLNTVTFKEEKELDETEYSYKVVKDGKKFLELEFEAEEIDQEIEIEVVTTERGFKESYKFEKELENGKHIIVIKYKGKGNTLTIKATGVLNEETGVVEYTYKVKENNKEYHYEKKKNNDNIKQDSSIL